MLNDKNKLINKAFFYLVTQIVNNIHATDYSIHVIPSSELLSYVNRTLSQDVDPHLPGYTASKTEEHNMSTLGTENIKSYLFIMYLMTLPNFIYTSYIISACAWTN
jgi:hypothetical protein